MEDLEEVLVESIRGSLRDKADAARREAEGTEGKKKRKKRQEMSDDEEGSGEDDDFYDRTAKGGKKAKFGKVKMARQKAVTVDELFGRKEALIAEVKRLREAVAIEESSVGSHGSGPGGTATQDPLDEFMNGVETSMEVRLLHPHQL